MGAQMSLLAKLPISWEEIDALIAEAKGSTSELHRMIVHAVDTGRLRGRAPTVSTLWRRLRHKQGLDAAEANKGRDRERWKNLDPGSQEARAVTRVEAAVRRGHEAIQALYPLGQITRDEITRHQAVSKRGSSGKLRRKVATGNLQELDVLAADLESRAAILERRLARASSRQEQKTAATATAPVVELSGHGLVKPAGTEGVDPLYGTEGDTGWGRAADAAPRPAVGTLVDFVTPCHTDVIAQARWRMVAPLLGNGIADPRQLAAHWRKRFGEVLTVPGAEYPGIPREVCTKYRNIHWRTLYRWKEAIELSEATAREVGIDTAAAVISLRHQYPNHRRGPKKATAIVVERIYAIYREHPDWSAAAIARHMQRAGTDISERTVQAVVHQISHADRVEARGGPAGEDVILITRLLRESPYANRTWIIDNSFIRFDVVAPDHEGPLDETEEDLGFEAIVETIIPGGLVKRRRVRRLCLTTIIDACTRKILVVRVWAEAPSARTALLALREAMLLYGVPEVVYSDNGSDFRSGEVGDLLRAQGVMQIFSVPYSPRSRGRIERSYRTIKESILPLLPGYVGGSNPRSWHEMELLTIPEVEQHIRTGVEIHMNQRICRTTRRVPNEHYEASIGARGLAGIRRPNDEALIPLLLRDDHVRLDGPGIRVGGLQYHSDAFAEIANGSEVSVYHDPGRPTVAYVAMQGPGGRLEFRGIAEVYGPGAPPPEIGEQRRREAEFRAESEALRTRKREEAVLHDALREASDHGRITGIATADALVAAYDRLAGTVPPALPRTPATTHRLLPLPAGNPSAPEPASGGGPVEQPQPKHRRTARGGRALVLPWD